MNHERLQQLAAQYPEVQELLKDNYSLSVALLAKRIEARLEQFDRNHTRAQSKQHDRLLDAEKRIEDAAKYVQKLAGRVKTIEAKLAEMKPEEAKP